MRSLSGELKVSGVVTVVRTWQQYGPMGGFVKSIFRQYQAMPKARRWPPSSIFSKITWKQKQAGMYAEAEKDGTRNFYKEDVYSQKNLQQVTADYNSLKAQVKALDKKLALNGINPGSQRVAISRSVRPVSPISRVCLTW